MGYVSQLAKRYGKILIDEMIKYMKKKGKTGLGFTEHKNSVIFESLGLKSSRSFIIRFRYRDGTSKLIYDPIGDRIYFEGKDKLISKMIKDEKRNIAYTNIDFW